MIIIAVNFILAAILLVSQLSRRKALENVYSSEIVIPSDTFEKLDPCRTSPHKKVGTSGVYRYVVYYDSSHCSSCQLKQMFSWNRIIEDAVAAGVDMEFTFVFSPKHDEIEAFRQTFKEFRFLYPVYIDADEILLKRNKIMQQLPSHRSFIVGPSGLIEFIGDATRDDWTYDRFKT